MMRALKNEKESYRKFCGHTMITYHTCYTKHIQPILETSLLRNTHAHLLSLSCSFLLWDMRRRASATFDRQNPRIYHTCYTTHIQSIFEKSNPLQIHTCLYMFLHSTRRVFSVPKRRQFEQEQGMYIHSFRIFDDPSYWMDTFWEYDDRGRTVDVGVRMRAHAYNDKAKVGG